MSDSGEMSEFGYIMDLLARGKVSGGARGAAAGPPLRAPPGRSLGAPRSFPGRGWEPGVPAAAGGRGAAFSLSLKCAHGEFPACVGLAGRRERLPGT